MCVINLIEIFKFDIEMSYGNDNSHRKGSNARDKASKSASASLKEILFEVIAAHINENAALSPLPYYFLTLIETLSLLWFLVHPTLNLYALDDYFVSQINLVLKAINFYEFMGGQSGVYTVMVIVVLAYFLVEVVLIFISGVAVIKKVERQAAKYLRKIVNVLFLVTVKALSGPIIGLFINVAYCDNLNPYHLNQTCYSLAHIFYCCLAGVTFLLVVAHIVFFSTLYSIRNPFSSSFLAEQNRYYMYSKSVIKLICPVYFAIQASLKLQSVYVIFVPALWGAYIFFHRLFSVHSYKHEHFYLEYLMEGVLFGVGVNGALIYHIQGFPAVQALSLIYVFASSLLLGYMLVNLEKWYQNKFMEECLEGDVKKQNMQKFMLTLVDCFLHRNNEEGKIAFKVYSRIIYHNNQEHKKQATINDEHVEDETNQIKNVYHFLLQQLEVYLQESNSVILKTIRCYLLSFLGLKNSCLHQSLELQTQRLSLIDEFSIFFFRNSTKCSYELPYRDSSECVKFFQYQEQANVMQQFMEECALNNLEYWEQLCESDPSLPKLRNLATLYIDFSAKIAEQYAKVTSIMSNCLTPTSHYLHFLINIGVDVRDTMKIKQVLKNRLQNKESLNIILGGRLREQDLHMITVNTVGNNLGLIKNCSTQIKELLGYEKKSIIGKQVTKLMPKIYAQLHNSFILNYIHHKSNSTSQKELEGTRDSMDHPQKIVTPITSQNLLMELGLSLQMFTALDGSLVMGGILRKRSRGLEGLIMVEGLTGEILGVDKNFVKLMRDKVTGKQIIQEEVRLSAYLPEANIQKIQSEGFQNTLLEIGHLLEQENMRNFKLNVRVQLRQVKHYTDHKIVFLSIIESINSQNVIQIKDCGSKRSSLTYELQMIDLKAKKENFKQTMKKIRGSEVSINFSDKQIEGQQCGDLSDVMPLARKLDDYIQMKEDTKLTIFNNICYFVVALLLIIFLLVTFVIHNNYLNSISDLYSQMQMITDIPYQEAVINLNINRIWSVPDKGYKKGDLSQYASNLQWAVFNLSNSLTKVVEATQLYDYPLEYNQQKIYTFHIYKVINGTLTTYKNSMTLIDGMENYIACGRIFMVINYAYVQYPVFGLLLTQQIQYVGLNGDQVLPSIAENAINKFANYFNSISEAQISTILFSKGGLMLFSIVCLIGGLLFGKYLNKTNQQVLSFYHLIRLWEVCEMAYKCDQYLKSRCKNIRKQRGSSLLKIFPLKTFVDIIQNQKDKQHIQKQSQLISNFQPLQSQDRPAGEEKQEDTLVEKDNMVQIQWDQGHEKAIVAVSIVLLTIITVIGISMYLFYKDMKDMENSFSLLKNIGIVRKNLAYLNLYSYKVCEGIDYADYYSLVSKEATQFYKYSDLTYSQLGDSIFKKVYSQTELIQKYFTTKNAANQTALSSMYRTINQIIGNATDSILNLDKNVFKATFIGHIQDNRNTEFTMKIIYGVLGIFALVLMHFCYIQQIKVHRKNTINMLRMLPSWILQRTPEAVANINK